LDTLKEQIGDLNIKLLQEKAAHKTTQKANKRLRAWVHRIRYCAIACNNEGIKKIVSEIVDFYWVAEGEEQVDE